MRRRSQPPSAGFTLVELMMVTLIISLLIAASVPVVARIQRRARTAAVVNDFRTFGAAFAAYAQENGAWPADSGAGRMPKAMKSGSLLNAADWTRTTPIGGKYNWERNRLHYGVRYDAAISISGTAAAPLEFNAPQLLDIDRTIDDGDLYSGNFRLGAGDVALYVIEP